MRGASGMARAVASRQQKRRERRGEEELRDKGARAGCCGNVLGRHSKIFPPKCPRSPHLERRLELPLQLICSGFSAWFTTHLSRISDESKAPGAWNIELRVCQTISHCGSIEDAVEQADLRAIAVMTQPISTKLTPKFRIDCWSGLRMVADGEEGPRSLDGYQHVSRHCHS